DRRISPPSSLVEKLARSILNVSRACLNYNPHERPTMRQVTELLSVDDRLWMKMHVSEPHVEGILIPVEGAYFDTIDEALDMYTKYAKMAGFEIKKGGYNMNFVPFIGIDNHGKCVTLGLGMLLHEDTKFYMWLLNAFMTAFSHEPIMIVTDQDGAIKRAIEAVFKKAKHRLCMWHIMQKIPSKICKEIYDETDFKERYDKIVWNMFIEPLKFEEKWTTSRSESENPFFKSFTSPRETLVSFMMSYESVMERQRYGFLCRHILCVFKNHDINVIPKQYILRRWTKDIIPPDLRRQRNRYGEKNLTIERLTNEANFLVDDSLFLLSKDKGKMGAYVEKLKILLDEMKADMPNPPSRNTGDVIGGIFSITKPNQIAVQNPTKTVNKGEHLKKGERLKSEREKSLKVGKKN
nr:protein FAR1-related sequence 5-like [Tanacetum cinerariifolium]